MTLAETSLFEEPFCRPQPTETPVRAPAPPVRERGGARDVAVPLPADFRLASGEKLNQSSLVGRIHGRAGAPVVVVAGGISAGRFVHRTETNGLGWWSGAVSVRGPIDLSRLQVLSFDFAPGAAFADRPVTITTQDQARLLALLLDHLKVARVAAFVGCSYGGMVALAFAELFPDRADQLIVVSAAHRAHPQATAWRGIQRRILQFAVDAGRPEEDGLYRMTFRLESDGFVISRPMELTAPSQNPFLSEGWEPTDAEKKELEGVIDFSDGECPNGCPE